MCGRAIFQILCGSLSFDNLWIFTQCLFSGNWYCDALDRVKSDYV